MVACFLTTISTILTWWWLFCILTVKKELLFAISNDSAVNVLDLLPRVPNSVCFTAHWHERMELNYVISGSMTARIGGREVVVSEGCVAIIPPLPASLGQGR